MRLRLIAVGTRMPPWVREGFAEYAGRLPQHCRLELREIGLGRRRKGADTARAIRDEGRRMQAAIAPRDFTVALDAGGRALSTAELARTLAAWLQAGRDVALLVGGPDGLAPECLQRAGMRWSLSPLTLPHGLVRIVVAEQLYRAWSLLTHHPYHRA